MKRSRGATGVSRLAFSRTGTTPWRSSERARGRSVPSRSGILQERASTDPRGPLERVQRAHARRHDRAQPVQRGTLPDGAKDADALERARLTDPEFEPVVSCGSRKQKLAVTAMVSRCLSGARISDLSGLDWRGRSVACARTGGPTPDGGSPRFGVMTRESASYSRGATKVRRVDFHSFRRAFVGGGSGSE